MTFPRVKAEGQSFYHCVSRVVDRRFIFQTAEFQEEHARELLGKALAKTSLYFSPRTIKLTTCRVAAAHPELPLGAFARAAYWWSEHRPRIKVFCRTAAAKLESISRQLLRSRANQNYAHWARSLSVGP